MSILIGYEMNIKSLFNYKIGFLVIILVAGIVVYNLLGDTWKAVRAGDRLSQAIEELHNLEIKNKELKNQLLQVKSAEFIEQQARDKLGLVKEGETVVVIPEEKIKQVLGLSKKIKEVKFPNWLGWLKVFF